MERLGCVKWEGSALGLVSTNMQKQLILTSIQKLKYFFVLFGKLQFFKAVTRGDCLVLLLQSRYNDDGIVQQNIL